MKDVYDKISSAIDDGKYSLGVFIDLSKAFGIINHRTLISKLKHYGIRGTALEWFKSYLSNRQQYVIFNDAPSTYKFVNTGVPQGSTLGPLLFLIYINDITNSSDILYFILYADNTNLFYSDKCIDKCINLITVANSELIKLFEWFRVNKLSVNANKTKYIQEKEKTYSKLSHTAR